MPDDAILWSENLFPLLFSTLFGYLSGSIPFGLLLVQFTAQRDLRLSGSKNIGATNALRVGGGLLGAATLLCDVLKGTVVVLTVQFLAPPTPSPLIILAAAFGVLLGHIFPVWLRFKGGKGVATFLGILFALSYPAALFFITIWICCFALTRFSSLAGLSATLGTPLFLYATSEKVLCLFSAISAILVWIMHYQNILRLLMGREPRSFVKGTDQDDSR